MGGWRISNNIKRRTTKNQQTRHLGWGRGDGVQIEQHTRARAVWYLSPPSVSVCSPNRLVPPESVSSVSRSNISTWQARECTKGEPSQRVERMGGSSGSRKGGSELSGWDPGCVCSGGSRLNLAEAIVCWDSSLFVSQPFILPMLSSSSVSFPFAFPLPFAPPLPHSHCHCRLALAKRLHSRSAGRCRGRPPAKTIKDRNNEKQHKQKEGQTNKQRNSVVHWDDYSMGGRK